MTGDMFFCLDSKIHCPCALYAFRTYYLDRMDKVRLMVELRDFKGFSAGAM